MKRLAIALILAAGLAFASRADAQTLYTCGDGTVRNVQTVTETVVTHTQEEYGNLADDESVTVGETKVTAYVVTVQLHGTVYEARSSAAAPWNLDPTALTTGEAILVCANDRQIVLDRLDGTDFRATIVRAMPAPTLKAALGTR